MVRVVVQPLSTTPTVTLSAKPAMRQGSCLQSRAMWLIILEALLALGLLCFIVWWTMFHKPRPKDASRRDAGNGDSG